jgi:uncharacterized protein (DUF1778 family)
LFLGYRGVWFLVHANTLEIVCFPAQLASLDLECVKPPDRDRLRTAKADLACYFVMPKKTPTLNPQAKSEVSTEPSDKSGKFVFRTDPETHDHIARAAEQENMSINNWINDILKAAAKDTLGIDDTIDVIASAQIRRLIEDPDAAEALFDRVADFLKQDDARSIFRFIAALKKLLIGLDAVQAFFPATPLKLPAWTLPPEPHNATATLLLARAMFPFTPKPLTQPGFATALKKFAIGIDAVQPFLKEDHLILNIITEVESLLKDSTLVLHSRSVYGLQHP